MERRKLRAALAALAGDALRPAAVLGVAVLLGGCAMKGRVFEVDTRDHPPAAASAAPSAPTTAVLVQVVGPDGNAITSGTGRTSMSALNAATGLREYFELQAGTAIRNINGNGVLTDWMLSGNSIRCHKTQTTAAVHYLCEEER